MTVVSNLDDFQALDPFFRIIERGVAGLVDGEHFFDVLAEDVIVDYVITVPGYPRRVEGRHGAARSTGEPGRYGTITAVPSKRPARRSASASSARSSS
jgi:hypothetical protein